MRLLAGDHRHDPDLVSAVQGGDLDAFTELFRRHYPSVRGACLRRLGDALEADEVTQATFVRALERIHQCRGDRRFGPWVQVIARSLCADQWRARARVVPTDAPLADDHPDGARPEDSLIEIEQHERVRRAIADLPERQRRAITARALGLRPGEIAATLGLSIGAVDSLLLRARRRLALTYTSMASEGGAAAATTGTSTTAALAATLVVDHSEITDGIAAAAGRVASAVGSLPGMGAARGVASAVVGAGLAVVGPGQSADPPPVPEPPPAAAAVAAPAADAAGSPVVVLAHRADGSAAVTVTVAGAPTSGSADASGGRAPSLPATAAVAAVATGDAAATNAASAEVAPVPEDAGGSLRPGRPVAGVPAVADAGPAAARPAELVPTGSPPVAPVEATPVDDVTSRAGTEAATTELPSTANLSP